MPGDSALNCLLTQARAREVSCAMAEGDFFASAKTGLGAKLALKE